MWGEVMGERKGEEGYAHDGAIECGRRGGTEEGLAVSRGLEGAGPGSQPQALAILTAVATLGGPRVLRTAKAEGRAPRTPHWTTSSTNPT